MELYVFLDEVNNLKEVDLGELECSGTLLIIVVY